jgi:hypothetical protein
MATIATRQEAVTPAARLRVAHWLTALIIPLAGVAAAGGLTVPGWYRNPAAIVPALQG